MKPSKQFYFAIAGGRMPRDIAEKIALIFRGLPDGHRIKITIEEVKRLRSESQNAYYWAVVVPAVRLKFYEAGELIDDDEAHAWLRQHVGKLTRRRLNPFSGIYESVLQSSASLNVGEFSDYLENIWKWAAEVGIAISPPPQKAG